ncbi:phosphonate ABC transporter, permease protein PhnE [Corynebacterium sp. sy039]|uniref:phosphonate ABC transporter, permease protein PhnE n=1 Tax=Corynebacterium sp. sy039 TaxID=2599641 RepID=UPI0011B478C7|nr:phosphonate ABC transporter, permease protein PhnE [Corynebacterium sp. sy039]QDZ42868.1 phosphonate ABC transporter, permease protein PhnE [Corynebacterium sp. sy039]
MTVSSTYSVHSSSILRYKSYKGYKNKHRITAYLCLVALALAGCWSVISIGININSLVESASNASAFLKRMFPLQFPEITELLSLISETLAIVFLATLLSVVLSMPLALGAARKISPNSSARIASRALIVIARAIPDLVLAIIFMRIFGLGSVGGILAMGIHSVGMVAKLYADAIEELDDGPREAIESVGGTRRQQIIAAIPQALAPQIIATALHRFDINLRTSVLLGYVGVGGVGMAIADSLRMMNYRRGMALALVVLVLCIGIELLSAALRAAILRKASTDFSPQKRARTWADTLFLPRNPERKEQVEPAKNTSSVKPPWTFSRGQRVASIALLVFFTWAAAAKVGITTHQILDGVMNIPATCALFFPPSSENMAPELFALLFDTIRIALAATFLGAICAIPIGILAARNVISHPAVHIFVRSFIVIIRGIPELILAIIFVVISGLGAVAGTLALALGAVGLLSKLVADSLEETDIDVQRAIFTAGATRAQVFFAATLRQAAPAFIAHTLYLLDINIRSATLLGVVGAGGIGFQLLNAARVNQFQVVTYILLLIIGVVLCVEFLSMWLRKAVR